MSSLYPVLAAIISAAAALAGVAISNWMQLNTRKEKFDEFVYKERFSVYKDIVGNTTALLHLLPELRMNSKLDKDKIVAQQDEFVSQRSALHISLSRANMIASEDVLKTGFDFIFNLIAIPKEGMEWHKRFAKLTEIQITLNNAVRKDLGIDPISHNIQKTLNDPTATIPQ